MKQVQIFGKQLQWLADENQPHEDPDYVLGLRSLLEAQVGQFSDQMLLYAAGRHFSAALRKSPDNARLHVALGYLSLLLDDETQARIYLKKALRLEPELLQAYE
ncbi:MAG: hypothetical protein ACAI44_27045, partial [Candidatus Sericytochromatia bacterium]